MIDLDQWRERSLEVALFAMPSRLDDDVLHGLRDDLTTRGLENFIKLADGGANFNSAANDLLLSIKANYRGITRVLLNKNAEEGATEVLEIFQAAESRAPVSAYAVVIATWKSDVPAVNETGALALERRAFARPAVFDTLGVAHYGAGLKVFLDPTGSSNLVIEPLLADPARIFVQYSRSVVGQLRFQDIERAVMESVEYLAGTVRRFVYELLRN